MIQPSRFASLLSLSLAVQAIASDVASAAPSPTESTSLALTAQPASFEASFLKVSASCKVSHAAFDEVSAGLESISPEVIAIHALVESA